ncbi:hypothetical protein M9H77_07630 [Catharanthus roseus]|uniref:Uncharacterized protein n=1 Tax=Catharanthus roseus TaxID=4058 RepID=A0ACC0BVN6_CATRO|nr:hypothetical protein M9H77_07630 [Catharanthus roseus]
MEVRSSIYLRKTQFEVLVISFLVTKPTWMDQIEIYPKNYAKLIRAKLSEFHHAVELLSPVSVEFANASVWHFYRLRSPQYYFASTSFSPSPTLTPLPHHCPLQPRVRSRDLRILQGRHRQRSNLGRLQHKEVACIMRTYQRLDEEKEKTKKI